MGEIIEINIVCQKKTMVKKLLNFLSLSVTRQFIDRTIEIMDNWKYENVFEINDLDTVEQYIDNKIICITETSPLGVRGVHVEYIEDVYNYCVWYNPNCDISNDRYTTFIRDFLGYLSCNMMQDEIKMCAIGKEMLFEYEKNLYETIIMSHNVDIWILDKKFYAKDNFSQYKVYNMKNYNYDNKPAVIIF